MRLSALAPLVFVLLAAASSACQSNAPLEVSGIQLGRSLNTDNTVGTMTTTFRPSDTVYVSVLTSNTGSGMIGVRWEHEGRLANEFSKRVSYKGAAATEFHLQYPGGLPEGSYAVELFIDEVSVDRRTFAVRRD